MNTLLHSVARGLLIAALILHQFGTKGQTELVITNGTVTTCAAALYDSGGTAATGYQNNEDFTYTICPDIPGNVIYLTFFVFDLDLTGPGAVDQLSIYDGDNTSATTLGTYTGDDLQNLIVSGTIFNTSGCLTLVFHSNTAGTGRFTASILCTTPCEYPQAAAVMSEASPAKVCVGEPITFDATGSQAAQGFGIAQYRWEFDDGTVDTTSGAVVQHAFQGDGEHLVQLYLTDDNGCHSLNLVDLQVLVSTTPSFALTTPDQSICFGATAELTGVGTPTTWTGLPEANLGGGVFLPDDVGLSFTSGLVFEQFDPGQTITSLSDITSICVDLEHTWMGDLVMQVICPNGSTTIFHQQGGSGVYLGAANDNDDDVNPVQGECWHYCWSPTATNGTWTENATTSTTVAGTPPNDALNPGTYESEQPFSNLIGCPLNGEWLFQSTDLWAADNGFICAWEINFDPGIIPDITTYTPTIGADADSSYWTGPFDVISANADVVSITPDAPGAYPFLYTVVDDFGCTYDTTITVTVDQPFTVQAGNDVVICNTAVQLQASAQGASDLQWQWTPADGLSATDIPDPTVDVTSTTTFVVTANITGEPACTASDSVTVSLAPDVDPGTDTVITVCMTSAPFLLSDMLGGTPNAGGTWTDANGNIVPDTFDPMTDAAAVFTYTITTPQGCVGTSTLGIALLPLDHPACCGLVDAGPDTTLCVLSHQLHATTGNTGVGQWSGPADVAFNDPEDPQTTVTATTSGLHRLYWIEDDGASCYLIDSVDVLFTRPLELALTTTDAICFAACDGTATANVTGGNIGTAFNYTWSSGNNSLGEATALCAGEHTVLVADTNGCAVEAAFLIGEPPLLTIDSVTWTPPTCHGDCDATLVIHDAEAVNYRFTSTASFAAPNVLTDACAGAYELAIRDAAGCIGTLAFLGTEPPAVHADFLYTPERSVVESPTVQFIDASDHAVGHSWNIADLASFNTSDPVFTFPNKVPGTYEVCLTVWDANACTDSICRPVTIHDVLYIHVPNAFTPDGDGTNDDWGTTYNIPDLRNFALRVYDRWGEEVFAASDPNVHWNGTMGNGNGDVLKTDVYVYRLVYQVASTGRTAEQRGHVTLLK